MKIVIHQSHDKFFKRNLKEKKVAIDFLKKYLPEAYKHIDIHSLQLTEKSFILPELREVHADIIYKCRIKGQEGYLCFLLAHQSTPDGLMAFRILQEMVALCDDHLRQGHKKLPLIVPSCVYHGKEAPYPFTNCLYDCYDNPGLASQFAFQPYFTLIDLTALSDEEISQHGLVALMEMLLKHSRDKDFLSFMKQLLQAGLVQRIVKELPASYLKDMLNYILSTSRDESKPKAAQLLIQELIQAFPDEPKRSSIMTFAEQLKEDYKEEFMATFAPQLKQEGLDQGLEQGLQQGLEQGLQQGLQQGFERGKHAEALVMAKSMLAKGLSLGLVKEITKLPDLELIELDGAS